MAFAKRDVIVYLTDFPWSFLVKNFSGTITRTVITDFSKTNVYRNTVAGGSLPDLLWMSFNVSGATQKVAPITPIVSPTTPTMNGVVILDDQTAEAGGIPTPPRNIAYTRVKLFFTTADATTGTAESPVPYFCWEDEFRGLGDVDPTNEFGN